MVIGCIVGIGRLYRASERIGSGISMGQRRRGGSGGHAIDAQPSPAAAGTYPPHMQTNHPPTPPPPPKLTRARDPAGLGAFHGGPPAQQQHQHKREERQAAAEKSEWRWMGRERYWRKMAGDADGDAIIPILCSVLFLDMFSVSFVIPLIPHIGVDLGLTAVQNGYLQASYQVP